MDTFDLDKSCQSISSQNAPTYFGQFNSCSSKRSELLIQEEGLKVVVEFS